MSLRVAPSGHAPSYSLIRILALENGRKNWEIKGEFVPLWRQNKKNRIKNGEIQSWGRGNNPYYP